MVSGLVRHARTSGTRWWPSASAALPASCAAAVVGLENVPLWHERDISHSSAERVILPDAFLALDYMLDRFVWLMEGLRRPPRADAPEPRSQPRASSASASCSRSLRPASVATRHTGFVQRNDALWDEEQDFRSLIEADSEIAAALSPDALADAFDLGAYTRHVDAVFQRLRALSRKEELIHA